MNDVSANSYLIKALEDTLVRLYTLKSDEVNPLDLSQIKSIINRIAPEVRCEAFYFDNSTYKGASAVPTYDELSNIGRFLFDFESTNYNYKPFSYVLSLSPNMEYHSIKEVVAEILRAIDIFSDNHILKLIKNELLEKAASENIISGDRVFTFRNGSRYNIACTPVIVPFLVSVFESGIFKPSYPTDFNIPSYPLDFSDDGENCNNLLVKYGYAANLRYDRNNIDQINKDILLVRNVLGNTWNNLMTYPESAKKLISDYNRVLYDPTSGSYEKILAKKCIDVLQSNNVTLIDRTLIEENLNESVKSFFEAKKKGYSLLELDELRVEIEAMSTSDPTDKMYIITRIHKDIATAKKVMAKKNLNPAEKVEIENYLNELSTILKSVQAKKVKDETDVIKIQIAYPKDDYEN